MIELFKCISLWNCSLQLVVTVGSLHKLQMKLQMKLMQMQARCRQMAVAMVVTIAAYVPPFPFVTQIFLYAEEIQLAEGTEWTGMVPHSYSPHLDHRHFDCRNNPCCTVEPSPRSSRRSISNQPTRRANLGAYLACCK